MMSTKRRSSRATNATNILEQQRIDKALRRSAAGLAPVDAPLEHGVLSDQKCAPVWNIFSRYASRSPRLQQRANDTSPSAGGRAQRRRAPASRLGADEDGEDGGDAALTEALAPAAAAAAAEAAKAWDDDGHHVIDLLQPLLSRSVTAPPHVQEALMHIVLNAESHSGSTLPEKANRVLMQLLEWHPPAKLEDGVLRVNENLWTPVGCPWQAEPHRDKPRLQGLREAGGLAALVGAAHNLVVRAAEAVGAPKAVLAAAATPGASDTRHTGPPESADLGEIRLLSYWIKMLQLDLNARLGYMRQCGFRQRRTSILENSLVYRLMQTYTNWHDGSNSKPLLIRQLAATVVAAHMATKYDALSAAVAGRGGGAGGPSGSGAVDAAATMPSPHPVSPAEVGAAAAALLNMMYDVYGALDRMQFYVRKGAQGRDNDLVKMDGVMVRAIKQELPYKDKENLRVLLGSLPPAATVRLLVHSLADAATRRVEVGEQLAGSLREVVQHYQDGGVQRPSPQIRASDALRFLLEEPQPRQAGGSNWNWAQSNWLPKTIGLPLLVSQLTMAALQQAQQEVRLATRREAPGGGGDDVDMEDADGGEEDGADVGAAAWEAEAAEVAALYREVVERLQRDDMYDKLEPADYTAVALRCADRLVGRVEAGGLAAGGMSLRA